MNKDIERKEKELALTNYEVHVIILFLCVMMNRHMIVAQKSLYDGCKGGSKSLYHHQTSGLMGILTFN